ncbi:DoxX-like family protein [Sorangium sp. So ce1389]|uniref:DoxX-like family protein n=1 Tax=Sorangium sp. So ce1389 TaxID=3133336 RepID=UPI003F5FFECC
MQSDCTSSLTERALCDGAGLPRPKRLGLPRRSTKKASYRIAVPYWRLAYRLQIALMLAYMAIISVILPMAWLAPPGEVTKNLPLLAATWLLTRGLGSPGWATSRYRAAWSPPGRCSRMTGCTVWW